MATTLGNPAAKRIAWARLTEEYNATEINTKRTENQLKKCWDNMKTRRKSMLAQEKRERMRTGGGSFNPNLPSTSSHGQVLDEALTEHTDIELVGVIDSDYIPYSNQELQLEEMILPDTPPAPVPLPTIESRTQNFNECETERGKKKILSKMIKCIQIFNNNNISLFDHNDWI